MTVEGTAIGFEKAELNISLLMNLSEEYLTYDVPLELTTRALNCLLGDVEQEIEKCLPLNCSFKLKDTTVHQYIIRNIQPADFDHAKRALLFKTKVLILSVQLLNLCNFDVCILYFHRMYCNFHS